MRSSIRPFIITVAFGVFAVERTARADVALEFNSGTTGAFGGTSALGWSFTTNQQVTVYGLDSFDAGKGTHVRLYDGTGTTLASATASNNDPTEGSPIAFHYAAIAPVTLSANGTYYVVEDINGFFDNNSTIFDIRAGGLTTNPAITYEGGVAGDPGTNPMSNPFPIDSPGYFGPDFDISPLSAVPEPSPLLAVLAATLAGSGYAWRRRKTAV